MVHTGIRIKRLRERRGWSQLKLAAMINVNNSVLSRIESGKRQIDDELLCRLADVFDVSADHLLGRGERVGESSGDYASEASRMEDEFFARLRHSAFYDGERELTDDEKRIVMEMLLDAAATAKKIISRTAKR